MTAHVWLYSEALPITIKQCLLQLWSVERRHSNVPYEIEKQEFSLLINEMCVPPNDRSFGFTLVPPSDRATP